MNEVPMSNVGLQQSSSSQNLLSSSPSSQDLQSSSPSSQPASPASTSSFVSQQSSSPPNANRPARPVPSQNQFTVGMQCQAKYSGDGMYYRAVIDSVQNGQYLVRYPDFGNDSEWLPASSLKP
jgi:hypothetical protein